MLVAAEIRFSDAPRLRQQETLDAVSIAFDRRFPAQRTPGWGKPGRAGPGAAPQLTQRRGVVLRNTESTEALTATPTSLTYETTDRGFAAARDALADGCRTLTGLDVRPALTRIGLRYINEVRVPDPPTDMRGWSRWTGPRAVGAADRWRRSAGHPGHPRRGDLRPGARLVERPTRRVHRRGDEYPRSPSQISVHPGPFFGLDFDGFTEFGADPAVLLDAAVVVDVLPAAACCSRIGLSALHHRRSAGLFLGSGLVSSIGTPPMGSAGRQGV